MKYLVPFRRSLGVVGLILLSLSTSMYASSPEDDSFFVQRQELFYNAGISFAHQVKIVDGQSLKDATVGVYNEVQDLQDLVNLFVVIDENIDEENIPSFDQLIDIFDDQMSQADGYEDFKVDLIILMESYQRIFSIFIKMCPDELSFETFVANLNDCLESSDDLHEEMKEALNDFTNAFNIFEDRSSDFF